MGLDLIELTMNVEEEFSIIIDDREASSIETVGQLYQYVRQRLGLGRVVIPPCESAAAFHQVRRALVDAGVMGRDDVTLETDLVCWSQASPPAWGFFLRTLGLRSCKPPLSEPQHRLLRIGREASAGAVLLLFTVCFVNRSLAFALLLPAIAALVAVILLGAQLDGREGVSCGTVRGFIKHHAAALSPRRDEEIWERIAKLVAEQAGVDGATIEPQTRFIEDLKL